MTKTAWILLSCLLAVPNAFAAPGDLDGSNWKMKERGWKRVVLFWRYDHLTFKDGRFISIDCKINGYPPAPYAVTASSPEGISWTAVLNGERGGKVQWQGLRSGDRMSGSYVWVRPDGSSKTVRWKAAQVMHEHPEHPHEAPKDKAPAGQEHPAGAEHPKGQEHPK